MKKSWRAILCGIMAIAMTASLAGCGSSDDSSSESDSSSAAETTAADSSAADESSTDADSSSDESSESSSDDSSTADESSVVYGNYEIEAEDGVDSACADVIKAYFTAIEEQDFNAYKATLYDYYYNVYNDWLQDNQGYGMETTMEQMHQSLLDSAGGDHLVVTGITVKLATIEGNADEAEEIASEEAAAEETTSSDSTDSTAEATTEGETEDLPTQYLSIYEQILGEGFADEVKKDVDKAFVIAFTMKGTVDGGEEKTIMDGYDLMMVEKDGAYYILG